MKFTAQDLESKQKDQYFSSFQVLMKTDRQKLHFLSNFSKTKANLSSVLIHQVGILRYEGGNSQKIVIPIIKKNDICLFVEGGYNTMV